MSDENISWEEHIRTVKTKLAKNIELLYRTTFTRRKIS